MFCFVSRLLYFKVLLFSLHVSGTPRLSNNVSSLSHITYPLLTSHYYFPHFVVRWESFDWRFLCLIDLVFKGLSTLNLDIVSRLRTSTFWNIWLGSLNLKLGYSILFDNPDPTFRLCSIFRVRLPPPPQRSWFQSLCL